MDQRERTELYLTSIKLSTVSIGLENLIRKKGLNEHERLSFEKFSSLLCKLDYDSPYQNRSTASVVLATSIRPYFYEALMEQRGWSDRQFLDKFYLTLESKGEEPLLSRKELESASKLCYLMCRKILSDIRKPL